MALQEIPEAWRKRVCAVLESESRTSIEWTKDARQRYEAAPGATWDYEAYDAFLAVLRPPALGCPITMERPAGETYEFYVPFEGSPFYGKILLRPGRDRHRDFLASPAAQGPTLV